MADGYLRDPESLLLDPDAPYRLYKSVFISRLSSEEAEAMEGVLAAADAKLRLMFNGVEHFISDDPLFATLQGGSGRSARVKTSRRVAGG